MEFRRVLQKRSKGFSLIEMIAACVMVSILVPGISIIVRGTMMNIAFTNMAVFANMEADYAQRKFIKHINGVESFSEGNLTVNNLRFTSYLNGAVYEYTIDNTLPKSSSSRTIKYSKDSGTAGILLQKVVKDTTINAVNYVSKFTYKGKDNTDLGGTPTAVDVHGVELTFYLLRGESFYKYTTYATIDEDQLDI